MIAWTALAFALVTLAAPQTRISAGERAKAVLLVMTPPGAITRARSSVILESARVAFGSTAIEILSAEQVGLSPTTLKECPADERFGCWLRLVHPNGSEPTVPRYLLVVGVIPLGEQDELSVILLDADRAWPKVVPLGPNALADEIEQAVFATTLQIAPQRLRGDDAQQLGAYFGRLVEEDLAARLTEDGNAATPGSIRLEVESVEVGVELDGHRLGTLGQGTSMITDVRPGGRTLTIEQVGAAPEKVTLEVETGGEVSWRVTAPSRDSALRAPTIVGGLTVAAAGAVVLVIALAKAASPPASACLVRSGDSVSTCPDSLSITSGGLDDGPAAGAGALDARGVPLGALGLGLLAGGASMGGGALFLDVCAEETWWCLGAGLLIGAATFAATAVVSP